jgi:3-mercaptopropionate dioxygenase
MKSFATEVEPLIEDLRAAARLRDPAAIAERIKEDLERFIPEEGLALPERFRVARPDGYSRRLLYRDTDLGFTALVMTWGPGQATPLHDHAGIWCVEGVMEGQLQVSRWELLQEDGEGLCRFAHRGDVPARAGSAGALIPPFEHHVLANASTDRIALTLHVYGGEMDHCSIFVPEPGAPAGTFRRHARRLTYDE